MSVLDRLRRKTPSAKAVTSGGAWTNSIPGVRLLQDTPQEKAKVCLAAYKVGWFHKAGRKIAEDVSGLDWSISDGDMEEGETETVLDRQPLNVPFDSLGPIDQLQRLLERPNPRYTGRQLLRKTQIRLDFAGAAAWYLEGAGMGLPTAIYGISPARMWPSYDNDGLLIGWVMDKDRASGGVPFDTREILWFSNGNADDDDIWGLSVVEAVYSQVPLTDLMARHTGTVLSTGGRLAGMMWPKDRALNEDEFLDAQRAWRNVMADPDAGKRLLIFPEPMEYAAGASTPSEIGIPELAVLNRDEILTAFPVSPYRLGVPEPGGLNSGEVRREDRRDYYLDTIHPRADLLEETIQVGLVSLYEKATSQTYDFDIKEPNLDDAGRLMEKAAAFKALIDLGFDPEESVDAAGLDHIKYNGPPAPEPPPVPPPTGEQNLATTVRDTSGGDRTNTTEQLPKSAKTVRETVVDRSVPVGKNALSTFLTGQQERLAKAITDAMPLRKAARLKVKPDWWDDKAEEAALTDALRTLYVEVGRGGLQAVADSLDRVIANRQVRTITDDLLAYGGQRIVDINQATKQALIEVLAEGTRRGYSIPQLIDGVADENYPGVKNVLLDNGTAAFSDLRAETIARTETMLSYNRAAITGYGSFGVERVQAIDGDNDEECSQRDGQVFSIDEALGISDHPNGTLDWVPVEKSAHIEPEPDRAALTDLAAAIKALAERQQPAPVVNNYYQSPDISFDPTIQMPEQTELSATLKALSERETVINNYVETPEIKIPPTEVVIQKGAVQVDAPIVNVEQPEITVNVPETPAPVINVTQPDITVNTPDVIIPETVVNVDAPIVNVNLPEQKAVKRVVHRNSKNEIDYTTDVIDGE